MLGGGGGGIGEGRRSHLRAPVQSHLQADGRLHVPKVEDKWRAAAGSHAAPPCGSSQAHAGKGGKDGHGSKEKAARPGVGGGDGQQKQRGRQASLGDMGLLSALQPLNRNLASTRRSKGRPVAAVAGRERSGGGHGRGDMGGEGSGSPNSSEEGYEERRDAARKRRRGGGRQAEKGPAAAAGGQERPSKCGGKGKTPSPERSPSIAAPTPCPAVAGGAGGGANTTWIASGVEMGKLWKALPCCCSLSMGLLLSSLPLQLLYSSLRGMSKEQRSVEARKIRSTRAVPASPAVEAAPAAALAVKLFFTSQPPHMYVLPLDDSLCRIKCTVPRPQRFGCIARLLTFRKRTPVCSGAQELLERLALAGLALPAAARLRELRDTCLMAWLSEPQLLQRDEKELDEAYCLTELVRRHRVTDESVGCGAEAGAAGREPKEPLQQLSVDLSLAMGLFCVLQERLKDRVPLAALRVEMQVAAILARMQRTGVEFDPHLLQRHESSARVRMAECERAAARFAGHELNLSSPQQLAEVLYTRLKLPLPADKTTANRHAPTDENTLKALTAHHPLPAIVLEYRQLQNLLSKWVDADWVRQAASKAALVAAAKTSQANCQLRTVRCHCSWHQTCTATGRLSSSGPNLQAVTKYTLEMASGENAAIAVNIRDAFVAAPGYCLIAVDYSQMELRILAHLSGDPLLTQLLRSASDEGGDVFNLIAATLLRRPTAQQGRVTAEERNEAKRLVYGMIYGLTPWGLAKQLGCDKTSAGKMINSFLATFTGVRDWLRVARQTARANGFVQILSGRCRPLKGIASPDVRERAEAERKAVNTAVQGFAADLIKLCMCKWSELEDSTQQQVEGDPPAGAGTACHPSSVRLIAQIHDELLFECSCSAADPVEVAHTIKGLMEGIATLQVPLVANVTIGERWGSLRSLPPRGTALNPQKPGTG